MKDFGSFCMNPFSDDKISLSRKQAYGENSIQRIAVQNINGQFDERLTQTIAVQESLFGSITSMATLNAVRAARTRSVNAIMIKFRRRNTRLNNYLIASEEDELPMYSEFFPQGVMPFTRGVSKANIEQRMEAMIASISANIAAAGGATVLKEYQDLLADYRKARGKQLAKTGELSNGMVNRRTAEEQWDEQMFSSLLFFANLCHNKPGNLLQYLNAALLNARAHHETTLTGHVTGKITDANGHPLYNLIVQVKGRKGGKAHSDANGNYLTRPLPIGKWQIEYRKGKKRVMKEVEIANGETLVLDVVL